MPSLLAFLLFQLLCAPAELTSDADDFGLAGEKLEQAEAQLLHSGRMGSFLTAADKKKDDGQLQKITCDSNKMAVEQIKGLASQVLPQPVLRPRPRLRGSHADASLVLAGRQGHAVQLPPEALPPRLRQASTDGDVNGFRC